MNKDFMEGNIESKKFLVQVNSLAIANSVYLYLIFVDDFQRDLKIQWFILVCDWFFLICFMGSENTFTYGILTWLLRNLVVMIWGSITYKYTDLSVNPEY